MAKKKRLNFEVLLYVGFFLLSSYLMLHTFGYDSRKHEMLMASRVWSDFGAHIPLIRSFSLGHNFPPEYALFPGEKIKYHFLFYMITGLLEKVGFRIDWALNIPSILGFFLLLVLIYKLALLLFEKKVVGLLSVLFFLFNGSLSFLKFFEKHPLGPTTLRDIFTASQFATFGPWDRNLVTAFVHLNIYTNQRHIALSFALVLLIMYLLLKMSFPRSFLSFPRRRESMTKDIQNASNRIIKLIKRVLPLTPNSYLLSPIIGILLGSLFFFNQAALLIAVIFCAYLFLFHKETRLPLALSALIALPFLMLFLAIASPSGKPVFEVGYLSQKPFQWGSFLLFWWHNLGLHLVLIPLGILLAPRRIRFLFIPLVILFIFPNTWRVSTDMINNHKFFNFFTIIGGMYTAYALTQIWQYSKKIRIIRPIFFLLLTTCSLLLTFSGLMDFIVIHNDYYLVLTDIPANKDATFFATQTPRNSVVLNSTWFYHPASIAGRKIYNGYSFFTWSAGYKAYEREAVVKEMYHAENSVYLCALLRQEHIDYVEVNEQPEGFIQPVSPLWQTLEPMYYNPDSHITVFDVKTICGK